MGMEASLVEGYLTLCEDGAWRISDISQALVMGFNLNTL